MSGLLRWSSDWRLLECVSAEWSDYRRSRYRDGAGHSRAFVWEVME